MLNYICVICGMQINEKNYEYNKQGILRNNEYNKISSCPFCGVSIKYITECELPTSRILIKQDPISLKILDHAVKLELFNGDFYKKASELAVDKTLKLTFEALSRIEYMHAGIHLKLGNFVDKPLLQNINYDKYKGDDTLINLAKKREEHAVAFYSKKIHEIRDENIKQVFFALSEVEREHIEIL